MSFLRDRLSANRAASCLATRDLGDGARASVAGIVLVRQRPGSAKGVVFMTLEDETGVANTVIWPKVLERYRKVIMTARLVRVTGRIQRHENIIHLVAERIDDLSSWLIELSEWAEDLRLPMANADEVRRPEPDSQRQRTDPSSARHPRDVRAIPKDLASLLPKSRDFH
jgi:error-prone DNA polymerase